jgi:hypothetical protein
MKLSIVQYLICLLNPFNPECSGWNGFKKKQMGQWMLDILKSSRLVGILIRFNPPDHILSAFHYFLFCFVLVFPYYLWVHGSCGGQIE